MAPLDARFKAVLEMAKIGIEGSLDAVCIVDESCKIVYANPAMKAFLSLRARDLQKAPVFCDLIKLAACSARCQIKSIIDDNEPLRLDETPGERDGKKYRILLKGVPLYDPRDREGHQPVGAILTVRDTTGEVVIQAKYHKLLQMLEVKNGQVAKLQADLRRMARRMDNR